MEMVILPTKRRDLFTGIRRPARGNTEDFSIRKNDTTEHSEEIVFMSS